MKMKKQVICLFAFMSTIMMTGCNVSKDKIPSMIVAIIAGAITEAIGVSIIIKNSPKKKNGNHSEEEKTINNNEKKASDDTKTEK